MRHPAAQPPLQAHSPRQNYHTFKKTPKSISCSWRQLHCILEQVNLNLAVKPTTKHAKCAKGIDYQDIAKKISHDLHSDGSTAMQLDSITERWTPPSRRR
jgi:hypothetical protein